MLFPTLHFSFPVSFAVPVFCCLIQVLLYSQRPLGKSPISLVVRAFALSPAKQTFLFMQARAVLLPYTGSSLFAVPTRKISDFPRCPGIRPIVCKTDFPLHASMIGLSVLQTALLIAFTQYTTFMPTFTNLSYAFSGKRRSIFSFALIKFAFAPIYTLQT